MSGALRGLLLLVCLSGASAELAAQNSLPLGPGSKIRIRTLVKMGFLGPRLDGTVERISGDTVVVAPNLGGDSQALLLDPETQLYVSTGRRSSIARGAAIGGLLGALSAGALATFAGRGCDDTTALCTETRPSAVGRSAMLIALGTVSGAIIGRFARHEIWKLLPILPKPLPQGLGFSFGL